MDRCCLFSSYSFLFAFGSHLLWFVDGRLRWHFTFRLAPRHPGCDGLLLTPPCSREIHNCRQLELPIRLVF